MTSSLLPSPAERRLARELAEIRSALDTITDAQRATQLANSTLYGTLTARDGDGNVRAVLGVQPDGTWAQVAQNGPPPDRPATPVATPSMNGAVITWNGQLVSGRPADLMGVRIYLSRLGEGFVCDDTTFVGTLSHAGDFPVGPLDAGVTYWCKFRAMSTSVTPAGSPLLGVESFAAQVVPGQVVAAALIAGIVDALALAAGAVTEAALAANAVTGTAIAPNSISSPHIVAQAIQALHMAVDSIQAGSVAADVITGRELRALAVLAEHINANAINAGHLQAGIIDADKLAALLVLATRIILGDPTGARLEVDEGGLDQFDESGARTLQFGADPAGGNFLTILDPTNPAASLASIADNGVITAQSFVVAGSMGYRGGELSEQFDRLPKGVLTWGSRAIGDFTTDMTGIGELEALCEPGRVYRIGHSACFVEPATGGQVGPNGSQTQGEMRLHYTLDGSRPTTASRVLGTTGRSAAGDFGGLMANFGQVVTADTELRLRVLITYQSHHTLSSRFITGGYDNGLLFWIEDVGPALVAGGVSSTGAGTGSAATASYTREWVATWTRSWSNGGATVRYSNGEMVQGYYNDGVNGDQVAAFGFNDASIRLAMAGSSAVDKVEVYLYAHHWYWNSGGQPRLRTHNSAASDTYPNVSAALANPTMGKPEGRWIALPTAVGTGFMNGSIRGFALDARDVARNLLNYGRFDGIGWGSPPRLRITFRAPGTGGTGGGVVGLAAPTGQMTVMGGDRVATTTWTNSGTPDATEVHEFLVDPANTLKATIAYPGTSRASSPLAGGREYQYAVRHKKGTDYSGFSNRVRILADGSSVNEGGGDTPSTGDVDTNTAAGRLGWGTPIAGDEFTYSGVPNSTIWSVDNGAGFNGNGRRLPAQVTVDGTKLVGTGAANGDSFRLAHRFYQQYGRWEARCRSYMTGGTTGGTTTTQIAGVNGIPRPAAASNVELNSSNRGDMNITASGTASQPRIYDGGGFTCGRVTIDADYILIQNYNVRPNSQYAFYVTGSHVTIQNCDIKNVSVSGDGDLNAFTLLEGSYIDVLYNTSIDYVSGDPGGSHTDWIQTWVSSRHPTPVNNVRVIGNVATGPANPSRDNSIPSIHQIIMVESAGHGGNSGGSGTPSNWLVSDNTFAASWGQDIKLDAGNDFIFTRNKFQGSSDRVIAVESGSGNKFYSDNTVGSGYGQIGYTVTAGAGPGAAPTTTTTTTTTPVSNGNDYQPALTVSPQSGSINDGEYDFLRNDAPGALNPAATLRKPQTAGATLSQFTFTGPAVDLTQWHNLAVEWTSTGLTLFLDGVQWGTASGGADGTHGNVQAMPSGGFTIQLDNVDGTNQTAARFEVEWVRVYSLTATGGSTGGGGGTGGGTTGGTAAPANPGEALWWGAARGKNHYNVGIAESTTSHVDHTGAEIENGFSSQWFTLSPDKLWTIFKVQIDGATTSSGTKYPRSEGRELAENDVDKAAWDGGTGTHTHEHVSKIMHVPPNKSSVCFSQVHDASSDLARLQTEGSNGSLKLVLRNTPPGGSSETVRTVQASYTIGANVTVKWSIVNGNGTLTVNGAASTFPADDTGCYFKYGAYAQTNETIDDGADTCEVWVQAGSSKTWHTGYAANTTPVYTG